MEAKAAGQLTPDKYAEFLIGFRKSLDSTMSQIPPMPENKALHAQILSRLGDRDRERALADLTEALKENPKSPALLRASGRILFEKSDYPSAAEFARQAWEASDRTDQASLELLRFSEGRVAPGAASKRQDYLGQHTDSAPANRSEWTASDYKRLNAEEVARFVRLGKMQEPPLRDKNALHLESLVPHYALAQYSERDKVDLAKAIGAAAASKDLRSPISRRGPVLAARWPISQKVRR